MPNKGKTIGCVFVFTMSSPINEQSSNAKFFFSGSTNQTQKKREIPDLPSQFHCLFCDYHINSESARTVKTILNCKLNLFGDFDDSFTSIQSTVQHCHVKEYKLNLKATKNQLKLVNLFIINVHVLHFENIFLSGKLIILCWFIKTS